MPISLATATVATVDEAVKALAGWQRDDAPVPLHPGDLGWNWTRGTDALAASLRVWHDGDVLAVGLVEDEGLVRLGISPAVDADTTFAEHLLADLVDPARGVLTAASVSVEARAGTAFRDLLRASGWVDDEPWTPLVRDLAEEVEGTDGDEDAGLRVVVVDERDAAQRVAVHRASFARSTLTLDRWRAMAASSPYRRARCLLGYDARGTAVAATTVWSAGPGRPGLLEPLGVHADHRGRGHGRALARAAAATLRGLGASSATVCTPASNTGGVATYVAAGFTRLPDVPDLRRPA